MQKTVAILLLLLCPLAGMAQLQKSFTTPDALFGHIIGSDISRYPEFKKEITYGQVEMGMFNIGNNQKIFGVTLEPEAGYAFYKGKLCSISFEYKNADAFDRLTELLGLPEYHDTRNDVLGELYSFAWQGNKVRISCPVFNYGKSGSQFITVEDLRLASNEM